MSAPVALLDLTDAAGIEHRVTLDAMVSGRRSGRYVAVCGDSVLAASLTVPESGYCKRCRAWRAGQ